MYKYPLRKSLSAALSSLVGPLRFESNLQRGRLWRCRFPARSLTQTICLHTEREGNCQSQILGQSERLQERRMKYVLVTGGVVSGLGKGVTASSIGVVLKACGLRVTSIKIGALFFTYLSFCTYLVSV